MQDGQLIEEGIHRSETFSAGPGSSPVGPILAAAIRARAVRCLLARRNERTKEIRRSQDSAQSIQEGAIEGGTYVGGEESGKDPMRHRPWGSVQSIRKGGRAYSSIYINDFSDGICVAIRVLFITSIIRTFLFLP